ncbi:MAG: hypothetical protein A3I44_02045 [Candidatus Sungbacteria bacterium RIFCSPLOWO2_02_FULL_51_17]|uniref:Uncharacterized protein n=1 Tax=Candidatus Sungbacteria bacterium RIFCSPHIGHO2_02_FULL_51_29 TaxID=1802273 RepID=A0A1G2KUQ3_9BACT|nr:MAG: hypothetical protein A2676_04310 [Candidatus Sungbacteria bacterium RIFCSPHIGHO2_01_FULL_51_22]OHA03155.1 MAG: hypothetical protein A3C16_01775 [Candidatus Sungbacteria bacterium RIFCSPHIGHO2_02_FULL_51_29]OHA04801.1 MAG: hypothetical protein A3B29_03335 [Candidatus Sungbacteria bacterium RIFCSPLOWO2_01_FULL_51_34]OHA11062.1 MAG: hypothetical protein A3I44_02045 [Candidatus Sungbacteria bacterium RIFCSPLOWO2_02_FULL_51_17]
MKYSAVTFLILCIAGIGAFGFLAMSHSMSGNTHVQCMAAVLRGTSCPEGETLLSFLSFHVGFIKAASLTLYLDIFAALSTLLLFLLFLFFVGMKRPVSSVLLRIRASRRFVENSTVVFFGRFLHWLCLHENSPALSGALA